MTPMIDVVFLLIIFFLVSSHLVRQETQMELSLPVAASGDDDPQRPTPRITINVDKDGTLWVAGQEIPKAQLATRLQEARSSQGDDLEVRIRASRKAVYRFVEPVMLACTRVKIWNVTYAVYRESPE